MQQHVLVIDDSKAIHALAGALLADESFEIHSAMDGEFGLTLAASLVPDLILLDIDMPGITGFETCKKLKANPVTADVPVIFLTSLSSVDEKVKGLELGAVDYVTKPFSRPELLARVRASLRTNHLVQLLTQKAMIDPLTGLGNRAMLTQRLAAETALHVRFSSPLSCIMLDVDQFKTINDVFGHPFGDHVLKKIAEILTGICRLGDVACRYGGDEFVVIAPRTAAPDAALLADRIRAAIAEAAFNQKGQAISITCSCGVADTLDTFDRTMLERADDAMYDSKKKGRNRVSVSTKEKAESAVA
jgi:two-component system cell cycle response regulator